MTQHPERLLSPSVPGRAAQRPESLQSPNVPRLLLPRRCRARASPSSQPGGRTSALLSPGSWPSPPASPAKTPKRAEAGSPLAGQFRDFLSRELAGLQGRLLEEFEHQVDHVQGLKAVEGSEAQDVWAEAGGNTRQTSDGSEFQAGPLDMWGMMVSSLLVKDSMSRPGGMNMANLVANATDGHSTLVKHIASDEEDDDAHPHPEWLEAPSGIWNKKRSLGDSRGVHRHTSLNSRVEHDRRRQLQARSCFDKLVIHPDSKRRVIWCILGVLLLVYDAFTIPMEAVDLWSASPPNLLYVALGYWILDFLAHLLTGYHHDVGVELRASKTVVYYAKGWLAIDLAIIALDVVFLAINSSHSAGVLRLVRTARFTRLIRLHKSFDALKSYMRATESAMLDLVVRIVRVLAFMMLICHLTACTWFGVGNIGDRVPDYFVEGSWVEANVLEDKSDAHKYAMALHWSITQFTPATNNIVPVSTIERFFSVGVVLIGMVVFSAFLSSMTSAVNELKSFSSVRTRDRRKLVTYMKSKSVTPDLSQRVLYFFDAEGSYNPVLVENDLPMLCQLPESSRICLHGELYMPLLRAMPVVSRLYNTDRRPVFLEVCHKAMLEQRFVAQQEIFVDGVESAFAYLVVAGKLEYTSGEHTGGDTEVCLMPPKSCLAEGALWVAHWHHRGSLLAHTTCSVVKLDCSVVRRTIRNSFELLGCLRCFAILFAHHAQECVLTDLGPDKEVMREMCDRALRFCKLEASQSKPDVEEVKHPRPSVRMASRMLRMVALKSSEGG